MAKKTKTAVPNCAVCDLDQDRRICMTEEGVTSKGCPTVTLSEVLKDANREYDRMEVREFARQASIQEAECYANRHQKPYVMQPSKPRIIEICEFAEKMGYKRLGMAFCIGLAKESGIVEEIFRTRGFEVVSVLCKAGRTSKTLLGLKEEEKIFQGRDEAMCNPVYQAKVLNHEKTDFNVLIGLCVGHDSLFFQYASAPTTVLAVKDRLMGHNPLAAIYMSDSYYRRVKLPDSFK